MLQTARPFEVLFLTNFSDSCFRAIPAVAQLSDEVDVRLTLLHAYGNDSVSARQREAKLRSFFPEADDYASCQRLLVDGSPVDAARRIHADRPVDLVIAPAGDPLGLPRLGHRSLRTRLIREAGLPVWTSGTGTSFSRLVHPSRNVVCFLDVERETTGHLRLAADYARALNATLHLVHLLPEIHDGSVVALAEAEPFDTVHALKKLRRVGVRDLTPEVHVTTRVDLVDTLRACDADVVFLDGARWMNRRWLTWRMRRLVDILPCPAICVNADRGDLTWSLTRNAGKHLRRLPAFDDRPSTHDRGSAPEVTLTPASEPMM